MDISKIAVIMVFIGLLTINSATHGLKINSKIALQFISCVRVSEVQIMSSRNKYLSSGTWLI